MSPQEPSLPGFGRGEFEAARRVDSSPEMELKALPKAAKKERVLSLTLSCDSLEDREELAEILAELGYPVSDRRRKIWKAEGEPREDTCSDDPLDDL